MSELLITRESEGGELPVEVESAYVERLNDLWYRLSKEEQTAYEAELSRGTTLATDEDLKLIDCPVTQGEHAAPRREAA